MVAFIREEKQPRGQLSTSRLRARNFLKILSFR
jgi:hypothetical protein